MMSAKEYKMIARALHEAREAAKPVDRATVGDAAEKVALALQLDNPRFDMAKFWAAVNLGKGI